MTYRMRVCAFEGALCATCELCGDEWGVYCIICIMVVKGQKEKRIWDLS